MKLTERLVDAIAIGVSSGVAWEQAAMLCTVPRAEFLDWVITGRKQTNSIYAHLVKKLEEADQVYKQNYKPGRKNRKRANVAISKA